MLSMSNRARDLKVKRRYENKEFNFWCLGDAKCVVESLLSQSIAFARTAGWAVQTVETLVQCMRDQMQSKTLPPLHGAIRLVLESITVLRKSTSDVGWKEETVEHKQFWQQCAVWLTKLSPQLLLLWLLGRKVCALLSGSVLLRSGQKSCLILSCGS